MDTSRKMGLWFYSTTAPSLATCGTDQAFLISDIP
jgi:hypothetical protein